MELHEEFIRVAAALQSAKIDFAVCGGFAMAIHGFPRFTKDIDLLVLPGDVERIIPVVQSLGFDFDAGTMQLGVESRFPQDVRRINKVCGTEWLVLDLLIVNPRLDDVWKERETFAWGDVQIAVVAAAGLAKMKRRAGRPQDLVDIVRLGFDPDDPAIQAD